MPLRIAALTLLLAVAAAGQTPTVTGRRAPSSPPESQLDSRVKALADNSFPVRSIDPEDADFRDLQFLKSILGNARVVQLGDQTHGDGATIYARGRLVRFLQEQMGFDVLVWESGLFTCEEMNEAIQSGVPVEDVVRQGLHPVAAQSGLLLPLFRYIGSTFRTDRPLRQAGLDVQDFLGDPQSFPAAVRRLWDRIDDLAPDLASASERQAFEAVVNAAGRNLRPTAAERRERQDAIARVKARLNAKSAAAENARTVLLLQKALDNLAALEELSSLDPNADPPVWKLCRDTKMGENLLWLLDRYHRGQKLIVLVGGGHAAHDVGALYAQAEKSTFTRYRTMGDIVHEHLGPNVYTIQFAASGGQFGNPLQAPRPLTPPRSGSWRITGIAPDGRTASWICGRCRLTTGFGVLWSLDRSATRSRRRFGATTSTAFLHGRDVPEQPGRFGAFGCASTVSRAGIPRTAVMLAAIEERAR